MTRVDDHAAWYEETVRRIAAAVKAIGLQCGPEDNLDEQLENYVRSEVENYRSVATHFYGHGLEDAAAEASDLDPFAELLGCIDHINKTNPELWEKLKSQPDPTGQPKPCRWYLAPKLCNYAHRWFASCPHAGGVADIDKCCYYE